MKTVLIIFSVLIMYSSNLVSRTDYRIYKSKSGKEVTLQEMAKQLAQQKVIFFGEYHDDAICHQLELELLQELYKIEPKIVVSLEMFERDVQGTLNDYLAGKIDEMTFLGNSRPWPNYDTDYKPLLEFAKAHKLPVLAANVPRRYAGMIAKDGVDALKSLPEDRKAEFAKNIAVLDDKYKAEFMKTMNQNMGHGMPGMPSMFDNMYVAQCLKDDTMAESIDGALGYVWRDGLLIHYNGDFHSRYKLGTAQKLKLLAPKTGIAVISPTYIDSQLPFKWDKSLKQDGDFIIMIHQDADATDNSKE